MIGDGVNVCGVCGQGFAAPGLLHGVPAGLWLLLGHRLVCRANARTDQTHGSAS